MGGLQVQSILESAHSKFVHLSDSELVVPKARSLKAGEALLRREGRLLQVVDQGTVLIAPAYEAVDRIWLGAQLLPIRIREPLCDEDWESVSRLRSFHYRARPPFGRQGVLLAEYLGPRDEPEPCGLIEVGAAPICNAARDRLLDAEFRFGDISWTKWNYEARGKHCKRIASITRVIVDPEFRGLGLSTLLLRHAANFCGAYWQLGGSKPLFCEIVADMLRYHSFATSAGFSYAGQTEGNLHRVAADLRYQVARFPRSEDRDNHGESAVERMQWRYARFLEMQVGREGRDLGWVLRRLESMDRDSLLRHLALFQDVVRLPKPVFLKGLTPSADKFIRARATESLPSSRRSAEVPGVTVRPRIRFDHVRVRRRVKMSRTLRSRQVCLTFGLPYNELTSNGLEIDASIPLGSIVLVTGRSGTGKTTLLRALRGELRASDGVLEVPDDVQFAVPMDLGSDLSLIDAIGGNIESALETLACVGLSEPSTYLLKFDQLSDGQKERARLGSLLQSGADCWVVDNFGAGLDPLVMRIVAARFAKEARRTGITLFVSSTRRDELVDVLKPDFIVEVRQRRPASVIETAAPKGHPSDYVPRVPASPISLAHG
jgi:ABC-type transport system involved in cytochrome c biogenesis ATPase subunit/GNAT superfamily N-acetyltransferase